jgi:hypothetical protein
MVAWIISPPLSSCSLIWQWVPIPAHNCEGIHVFLFSLKVATENIRVHVREDKVSMVPPCLFVCVAIDRVPSLYLACPIP